MLTSRFRTLIAVCVALMTLGALLTPAAAAPPGKDPVPECADYSIYDNGKGQGIPFRSEQECARFVNKGGTLQNLAPTVTITYAASSTQGCLGTATVRYLPDGVYQLEAYYSIENKRNGSWEDLNAPLFPDPQSITVSGNVGTFTFGTNGAYSDPHPKTGVFLYHEVIVDGVSSGQVPVMGC